MKSFLKKLENYTGVQRKALKKIDCCAPLLYEFDAEHRIIRIFDLDHHFLGICQQDFISEFLKLTSRGWEFSFSVEEICWNSLDEHIGEEILLSVSAYAPGEIEQDIADVAQRFGIKGNDSQS